MLNGVHVNKGNCRLIMQIFESKYATVSYEITDDCLLFTMTFCNGQNQFSPDSVRSFNQALDCILAETKKIVKQNSAVLRAALVTVGQGKFYSTGLMLNEPEVQKDLPKHLSKNYLPLMGRFLVFPLVTVAAINGHAYAGGMVMAMANDFRIMRQDRGHLCMNEIELPSPVPAGMAAVINAKTPNPSAIRDCFLSAKRFSAEESLKFGLVDNICSEEACLREAKQLAKEKARLIALMPIVESIKRDMYPEAIALLEKPGTMKHVTELIMKSKL